ncbi:MAG TPA: hypothetical protein VMK16_16395 [Acidimicrobiales bacterium]|nr:hypothetical protein [Acidimicrobiales bacterium]
MKWSVSVVADGDREMTLDEIVELADAVAASGGIASGIGSTSYGAQIVVDAESSDEAAEVAMAAFLAAAKQAGLPNWPVSRVETIGEDGDE